MNRLTAREPTQDPEMMSPAGTPAGPDHVALALRQVHRAAAELRRGAPVLLRDAASGQGLLLAAMETVGAAGLAELHGLAAGPVLLLLAPARAAALLPPAPGAEATEVVALAAADSLMDPALLRSLADPTAERLLPQPPHRVPAPARGALALALVKLGRLLPALVAAPAPAEAPNLLAVAAADVASYPTAVATSLRRVAEAAVPLADAPDARVVAFRAADGGIEHLAILVGQPEALAAAGGTPLARIHSECFTGDLLGSLRCDCGPQLRGAIARMAAEGGGVLLYLAQEGRGIGLVNKLRAYALQDTGLDTLDANRALGWGADERNFLVAATMLRELHIPRVRLLTNNPEKLRALAACGVEVEGREAHQIAPNGVNDGYLETKARRFGHLLA